MNQPSVILPGATIGVLGSGQLGRMFAIAARELGYRLQIFSPDNDTPAGHIADREWTARYDDLEKVREFARSVDVVTFEFENVLSLTTDAVAEITPVRPAPSPVMKRKAMSVWRSLFGRTTWMMCVHALVFHVCEVMCNVAVVNPLVLTELFSSHL